MLDVGASGGGSSERLPAPWRFLFTHGDVQCRVASVGWGSDQQSIGIALCGLVGVFHRGATSGSGAAVCGLELCCKSRAA